MLELPMPILFAAGDDPLHHVKDYHFGAFTQYTGISLHVLFLMIAAGICIWLFSSVAKRIEGGATGGRFANFFEAILLFIRDEMVKPFLHEDTNRFLPIIWTFFFFILICNLVGLIPIGFLPGGWTATSNIAVTAALALCSLVIYHFHGIQRNGFVHYVKANLLVGPWFLWPLMIPIEILGHVIRPAALAIRLCANMVAGHTLLAVILGFAALQTWGDLIGIQGFVTPLAAVSVWALNFLELFVAGIQAFVFAFLTTVFISLSLHPEH